MRVFRSKFFGVIFTVSTLVISLPAQGSPPPGQSTRVPVLVELFTSEGCSSCPPADRLLQKLDQSQPFQNREVIVLSEHVDYWNHDGWRDPFSSSFFTERQHKYGSRFGLDDVYTPQMVVDGKVQFVGNDSQRATQAIVAAGQSQVPVRISTVTLEGGLLKFRVEADASPKDQNAEVNVVIALDHALSHVAAGENSGRDLTHVAVARHFTSIGIIPASGTFMKDVQLTATKDWTPENIRVIAFVQQPGQGEVLGAMMQRVAK